MVHPHNGRYLKIKAQMTKGIHIQASVRCCTRRLKNECALVPFGFEAGGIELRETLGCSTVNLLLSYAVHHARRKRSLCSYVFSCACTVCFNEFVEIGLIEHALKVFVLPFSCDTILHNFGNRRFITSFVQFVQFSHVGIPQLIKIRGCSQDHFR